MLKVKSLNPQYFIQLCFNIMYLMLKNTQTTQQIINAIPNPIIITSGSKIMMANQNFLQFFEANNLNEFLKTNKCVCDLFQDKKEYFSLAKINSNTLWTEYIFNSKEQQKVSILSKNGNSHIFHLTVEQINGNYLVVFTNITAKEQNVSLKEMAYHDHLTQIYNRQMFNKLYQKELSNKKRHGDSLSLIMLDIDYFKALNDTYGHDIGDKVLIALSELITKHLRTTDIFARWGGEEFLILMPRTDKATAYKKAQELRQIIEDHNNQIPQFTVSFGVTELTDYDKELSAFIRVDKALYQAKRNGKNQVVSEKSIK